MDRVQEPFAGTVPPASETLPAVLVTTPPAQLVAVLPLPARTRPDPGANGKVSVILVIVIAAALGFVTVMVSVDTPPETMLAGRNALAIPGAAAVTVRFAVFDAAPIADSAVVTPEGVLGKTPATLPETGIVTVQVPVAGIVSPVKVSAVWPAVKLLLAAPTQVPPAGPVAFTDMPLSRLVKVALVSAMLFVFDSV